MIEFTERIINSMHNHLQLVQTMFFMRKHLKMFRDLGLIGYLAYKLEPLFLPKNTTESSSQEAPKNTTILGQGKDGIAYLLETKGAPVTVVKINSAYGAHLQHRAAHAMKKNAAHIKAFYPVTFNSLGYSYPYEKTDAVSTEPADFLVVIKQLAELTAQLLEKGSYYWDFGSSDFNYRIDTTSRQLKVIDYGGNAFVSLENTQYRFIRRFAQQPNGDFLKAQFLLHIAGLGMGYKEVAYWQSMAQFSPRGTRGALSVACERLRGTIYQGISDDMMQGSFNALNADAWHTLAASVDTQKTGTLEAADIASIEFLENCVAVKGYQDFTVTRETVSPVPSRKLWNTQAKFKLVDQALNSIQSDKDVTSKDLSILDIGCNLGIYVFMAVIKHGFSSATGVDYNNAYILQARSIARYLQLEKCTFQTKKFSDISERYDVVMALGIIHHLYQRTENFGEIEALLLKMREISTRAIVVEFPSENDPKASKWTDIPGRKATQAYSLQDFVARSEALFSTVELIGKSAPDRYVYLLRH